MQFESWLDALPTFQIASTNCEHKIQQDLYLSINDATNICVRVSRLASRKDTELTISIPVLLLSIFGRLRRDPNFIKTRNTGDEVDRISKQSLHFTF